MGGCSAMGAPVIAGALGIAGAGTVGAGGMDGVIGVVAGIVYPVLAYPGIP